MKCKTVKTELGWEPAFSWDNGKTWDMEPGFAKPTRAEAKAALEKDLRDCARIDGASRLYQSQYDYACGYHD